MIIVTRVPVHFLIRKCSNFSKCTRKIHSESFCQSNNMISFSSAISDKSVQGCNVQGCNRPQWLQTNFFTPELYWGQTFGWFHKCNTSHSYRTSDTGSQPKHGREKLKQIISPFRSIFCASRGATKMISPYLPFCNNFNDESNIICSIATPRGTIVQLKMK